LCALGGALGLAPQPVGLGGRALNERLWRILHVSSSEAEIDSA
jgi:hypothetical protein